MRRYLFLLFVLCNVQQLQAETVYIQDVILVPLRGGASNQHRIINRGISSGTPLELITTDNETGFSLVRMENGTEGWLKTQYISAELIARDKLEAANSQLALIQQENTELGQFIEAMESTSARLAAENNALTGQAQQIQDELDEITRLSADVIGIEAGNRHLKARNIVLLDELDTLSQLNAKLLTEKDRQWFLTGALTLLVGMLPGFWFARKIYYRHGSSWR